MRAALIGGSGLIGRELASQLICSGAEVCILSRAPERLEGLADGAVARRWDGRSPELLAALLKGVDAVVNLAGESIGSGRWTAERRRRIRESRLKTTSSVVEAMRRATPHPSVLIQASAVGFYGASGDDLLTEDAPAGNDFLADVCREWEQASERVSLSGIRRAVARTGVVLSADGGALPRILAPFRAFVGGSAGSGRQWFPWIHLRDEARAIRFLIEREDAEGPFNLTAPAPVRNRQLASAIGRVLGRPAFVPAPSVALRLLLGEMSNLVLDGQRAVPERLLGLGFQFEFDALEPALRDLLG